MPRAFAANAFACFEPGSSSFAAGRCLYAAVNNQIVRIDLSSGSASVFATLPAAFGNIVGLAAADLSGSPGFFVAGNGATVTLSTAAAAGTTETVGTSAGTASGGLAYVGATAARPSKACGRPGRVASRS